ncbi:MAG TPA: P-II family nitrogen regulator [Methanomicrobia archaeon]|nr:P-II family nitrogen regulator [Methanomicrobia archaeon]
MKKIEAIIREEKLDEVKSALEKIGITGLNVAEVKGRGQQKGVKLQWRATSYTVDMLPKLKLEVVVKDKEVKTAVKAIRESAYTGNFGDGMIFVMPIEEVIRVRTGEQGEEAL